MMKLNVCEERNIFEPIRIYNPEKIRILFSENNIDVMIFEYFRKVEEDGMESWFSKEISRKVLDKSMLKNNNHTICYNGKQYLFESGIWSGPYGQGYNFLEVHYFDFRD